MTEAARSHQGAGLRARLRLLLPGAAYGIPMALFLFVTMTFWLLRLTLPVTVTDTEYLGAFSPVTREELMNILGGITNGRWYRPVETILTNKGQELWGTYFPPQMLVNPAITGAVAVLIYLVFLELVRDGANSWIAGLSDAKRRLLATVPALLFAFSVPMIETTWLFIHKSVMSDLFIVLTVFCYLRYLRSQSYRWLLLMGVSGLLAPWTRETAGIVGPTLLATAVLERHWDPRLLLVLAAMAFHNLYPTALPSLLFNQTPYFVSVIERGGDGAAGLALGSALSLDSLRDLGNPDVPFRVALFISPIALMLLLGSIALHSLRDRSAVGILLGTGAAVLVPLTAMTLFGPWRPELFDYVVPLALIAVVALATYRSLSKLLAIWLVVPLPPFFLLHVFDAWLKPAAVAFILLTVLWLAKGVEAARRREIERTPPAAAGGFRRAALLAPILRRATGALATVLAVLVVLQVSNLWMAHATFATAAATHQRVADVLVSRAAEGSAFVTNLRQYRDITYYSGEHVKTYLAYFEPYFPPAGGRDSLLHQLPTHLAQRPGSEVRFFVNERFGFAGFAGVTPFLEDRVAVEASFRTAIRYPLLDPSMWFIRERFRKFGGPSDLLHNFHISAAPFVGRADATYTLLRYSGDAELLAAVIAQQDVRVARDGLVEEGYRGFNIIGYLGRFYAVPQPEGRFEAQRVSSGGYSQYHIADSLLTVKRMIDAAPPVGPYLVEGDYRGLNIVTLGGELYAIPDDEGEFDIRRFDAGDYSRRFTGSTLDGLKRTIGNEDASAASVQFQDYAVGRMYRGYTVVRHGDTFYAAPQDETALLIGGVPESERFRELLRAPSREAIERAIDEARRPRLIGGYSGYRLYQYRAPGGDEYTYGALPPGTALPPDGLGAGQETAALTASTLTAVIGAVEASLVSPLFTAANAQSFLDVFGIDSGSLGQPTITARAATAQVATDQSPDAPAAVAVSVPGGGNFGGIRVMHAFQAPQDWRQYASIAFDIWGLNDGGVVVFDLFDGERHSSFVFVDDFDGWREFTVPLRSPPLTQQPDLSTVRTFYWDFHTAGTHRISSVRLVKGAP